MGSPLISLVAIQLQLVNNQLISVYMYTTCMDGYNIYHIDHSFPLPGRFVLLGGRQPDGRAMRVRGFPQCQRLNLLRNEVSQHFAHCFFDLRTRTYVHLYFLTCM